MRSVLMRRRAAAAILALAIACPLMTVRISTAKAADELRVGNLRVAKILFLGNSITSHGPAPEIGWTGDWGMAASSRAKDYVHQLLDRISKTAGGTPKMMIRNIADFERKLADFHLREALKDELAFEADVVILAIGENASSPKTDEARKQFADALGDLLAQLGQHGHPKVFVRSQFWPDAEKDRLLKKACGDAGGIFVDLGKLGTDPANFARSERQIEHAGVAGHPGDKGMAAIADELWRAMKQEGEDARLKLTDAEISDMKSSYYHIERVATKYQPFIITYDDQEVLQLEYDTRKQAQARVDEINKADRLDRRGVKGRRNKKVGIREFKRNFHEIISRGSLERIAKKLGIEQKANYEVERKFDRRPFVWDFADELLGRKVLELHRARG